MSAGRLTIGLVSCLICKMRHVQEWDRIVGSNILDAPARSSLRRISTGLNQYSVSGLLQ